MHTGQWIERRAGHSVGDMTESRPEPLNVGPVAGGNLRASDADRDQVATVLSTAYAEGRLTRDEHDERLDKAMAARTFDELIPLTHDLVVVAPPKVTTLSSQQGSPYQIDTAHASDDVENMVAVFGGVNRKGRWRMMVGLRRPMRLRQPNGRSGLLISRLRCCPGKENNVPESLRTSA